MNVLQVSNSSIFFWKDLVFVETRVGAEPKTVHLKPIVAVQRAKYDEIWQGERDIEFAVVDAQAQAKTAETRVYGFMEEVYSAAAHEVKQKRKDVRYEKLFKMTLYGFSKLGFESQRDEILRMKRVLELNIYRDEFRASEEELLDKALAEIERVILVREQLARRQRLYRQDVDRWKDEVNKVRQDVYGALVLLSETRGEAWARSFFPLQKAAKKLTAEEVAVKEAARAEKRLKKAKEKQELEALRLAEANKKAEHEKKKAEMDARMKMEAKEQAENRGEELPAK